MRKAYKIALIVVCIEILIFGVLCFYTKFILNKFHEGGVEVADIGRSSSADGQAGSDGNPTDGGGVVIDDAYLKMIRGSERVNILCLGIAKYTLADTMVVASCDMESKLVDLIFIPRDTYLNRKVKDPALNKINSTYYGGSTAERAQSAMNTVRDILQIPIHHYVRIEYEGVESIIDSIGGVEADIPFSMNYDDDADDLHIHFNKGTQLLMGKESVGFLRFRQNNDGTRSDGDIGRIKRQQKFLMNAVKKCLNLKNIPKVVSIAASHIKTSLGTDEMLGYAKSFMGVDSKNIVMHVLPGTDKYFNKASYFVHDSKAVKALMEEIYNKKGN